ncbi:hypothetical protein DPMN_020894 [Dreissena polymorpha]|uniref:Uncharacterized protein n=1 Tax=Dreissena polymorpha TaxID=45954 RepID=A0A9D4SAP0_DREPO|nr:hypothetical protein DPMN_020894 [Dreissena polymorpha]
MSPNQVTKKLGMCLNCTYIVFGGNFYQQIHGASMGSPVFADSVQLIHVAFRGTGYPQHPHTHQAGGSATLMTLIQNRRLNMSRSSQRTSTPITPNMSRSSQRTSTPITPTLSSRRKKIRTVN